MQNSIWKLLTAAGIIGIGTMVVLEVQNRLPAPSHASNAPETVLQFPGNETTVVPDASADLDRLLAGLDADGQESFELAEPVDAGQLAADDAEFVHVTAVNRTVLKDNLADEDNPFGRSFEADSDPKSAAIEAESATSAAITPTAFTNDAIPEFDAGITNPPKTANASSSTLFFNGNGQGSTQAATASNTVSPPAATPPAASTNKSPATPSNRTVERTAFISNPQDSEIPDLFLPDPVPELKTQPAPRNFPPTETPLMETPGFDADADPEFGSDPLPEFGSDPLPEFGADPKPESGADPTPNFDLPPRPANPPVSGGNAGSPESSAVPKFTDETSYFTEDEPVPTPPATPGGRPSVSEPASQRPFELDPKLDTPLPTPRDLTDDEFPRPSYPNRNSIPDLDNESPFRDGNKRDELSEPFDLPTIDNRPTQRPTDLNGSGGALGTANRTMSKVMRPQLSIQKRAPDTATVGIPHEYTIVVSNDGESPAYDVIVDDELGNGAQLVNSKPTADYDRLSGKLSWTIRELAPQAQQEIVVRITPTGEGTLDGIATVRFKAQVKSATVITAPKLMLEMTGPKEVKVGDAVKLRYIIRNDGSGDASNVVLRSVLPPGLKHSEGGDLEYEIEVLAAGEREEIDLTVVAAEPGRFRTVSEVTASGISADKAATETDIIGAQLTIQRLGPDRRFVGRTAKFQNIIANETNFEATNAVVIEQVPEGMRFVSADNGGEYNPQTGRIRWEIPRLAPGRQSVLEVELEAQNAGEQQTIVEVVESAGFRSQATENTVVTVQDYENMTADISRQDDPVAIGEMFGFTITIENRGTAVAKGVEMTIEVPPEIDIKAAGSRSVPARRQGNTVRYAVVEEIEPSNKMTFELKLQGQHAARNAVVRASLKYEQMPEPLIVSESVTIFDDRP